MITSLSIPLRLFALVGLVGASPALAEGAAKRQQRMAAYAPAGEPVACIDRARLRDTTVWDDRTIDFRMAGGQIYRNTLPSKCSQLGFQQAFAYVARTNRICSVDTITVLQTGGTPQRGATCGLGMFQPVTKAGQPAG